MISHFLAEKSLKFNLLYIYKKYTGKYVPGENFNNCYGFCHKCTNGNVLIFTKALWPTAGNGPRKGLLNTFWKGLCFSNESWWTKETKYNIKSSRGATKSKFSESAPELKVNINIFFQIDLLFRLQLEHNNSGYRDMISYIRPAKRCISSEISWFSQLTVSGYSVLDISVTHEPPINHKPSTKSA